MRRLSWVTDGSSPRRRLGSLRSTHNVAAPTCARARRVLLAIVLGALALVMLAPDVSAGAQPRAGQVSNRKAGIAVIQVDGLIDPPNATLILDSIRDANRQPTSLLVIKIASGGAVDVDPQPLVRAIRASRVPVAVWVGPSGGKAKGVAALLVTAATVAAVSNDSTVGPGDPLLLDDPGATNEAALTRQMGSLSRDNGRTAVGGRAMATRSLSSSEAVRIGATNRVCPDTPGCPTLGDFIVNLDGKTLQTASGPVTLSTAKVVGKGQDRRRQPDQVIRFRKLDLTGQAVHTLTSPSIAYLLLVVGLALIVFEFFTISIGLAGGAGAIGLIGAFVGFSHLPVTWWALLLILVAMFGYAIDVQAGRPLAWTAIATVLLIIGSLFLYGGSSKLDAHWWVLLIVILGTVAFMVGAMPVAVRSRFSTPTIGRERLIGELGEAAVDVAPDGVVLVRGARWRARTNRATPIHAGDQIRVIEVDGLVLEVEPESGGARDYRDRSPRKTPGEVDSDDA
jgi:membrane-bound serine protease (ClpP class)